MQRIISILLSAAILLTIIACGNTGDQQAPQLESSVAEKASEDAQLHNDVEPEASAIRPEPAVSAPVTDPASEQWVGAELESPRIKLSFGGSEAFVTLYDTPPGRDLLSRLPLTLEFQDYVGTEKISYLDQALTNESGSSAPATGDFAYYAPWGNLAIFYNDIPSAGGGLVILGRMESGKEQLAGMTENFAMTIELAN